MVDAFCELIASLNFPWLVCFFLGFSWPAFVSALETKQNQRKTRWAREPKSKTAHSTPVLENLVVWAAVLEIDVRSLLKHRAH